MTDHFAISGPGDPTGDGTAGVDPMRLDANWRAIEIELDAPRPSRIERLLRTLRVPSTATRLVVATPALRRAWYLAVAGAVLIALTAADPDAPRQSVLLFLLVAPLVGMLGVAMAYGPHADPAHELQLATPMRGLRVVAVRTVVVMVTSAVVITGCTLLNRVTRPFAIAWWLPTIAVAATALAVMTVLPPRRAATLVGVLWCGLVVISQVGDDPLVAFTLVGQVLAIGVAIVASVVVVRRGSAFDRLVAVR